MTKDEELTHVLTHAEAALEVALQMCTATHGLAAKHTTSSINQALKQTRRAKTGVAHRWKETPATA